MSEWKPIATAPTDGTIILLANDTYFSNGYRERRIEPATTYLYRQPSSYPNGSLKIGERFTEKVPNPNAGAVVEWWCFLGCSAFSADSDDADCFTPTHWRPRMEPPA